MHGGIHALIKILDKISLSAHAPKKDLERI